MNSAMIARHLADRSREIRVGLVGAGSMGKGLLYQLLLTPGVKCVGLAGRRIETAIDCAEAFGVSYRIVDSPATYSRALSEGHLPICEDAMLVCCADEVDVLVEATNAIEDGARHALAAMEHGKHVVLRNAEVDQAFGPALGRKAAETGVVCTSCDGDQHGVLKSLAADMSLWGFDLVMAGNIKGFHDIRANPESIREEADKRRLNYKMCTAFTDGTKLSIEMSIIANALGLRTDVPGMHGPKAEHVDDVLTLFDWDGLRAGGPVVDYVLGARPGGGVFVVGHHEQPYQQFMMNYFKMGEGPYYVFYRPYHLCNVESIASIVQPVLDGTGLLEMPDRYHTNVFTYAKTPLRAGTTLDGIGGHTCYGLIENVAATGADGLPITLAHDVTLIRDIAPDQPIRMSDIATPDARLDFTLYREGSQKAPSERRVPEDLLVKGHVG